LTPRYQALIIYTRRASAYCKTDQPEDEYAMQHINAIRKSACIRYIYVFLLILS